MSRWLAGLLLAILGAAPAAADPVADFYKGKQIRFDHPHRRRRRLRSLLAAARALHRQAHSRQSDDHAGQHAGRRRHHRSELHGAGRAAGRHRDQHRQPGPAVDQALGLRRSSRPTCASSTGSPMSCYSNQLLVMWHTSPTKTFDDAKQRVTTIGTTGAGSVSVQYPAFYNNVLGTKFKIVFGYPGGQHIDLAMERGEVEGRGTNPYSGWMASKPTWIPKKQIIPLIQAGIEKEPALPDVPLIIDQPVRAEDKPLLDFMANGRRPSDARSPPRRASRPSAWRRCARLSRRRSGIRTSSRRPRRRTLEIRPHDRASVLQQIILGSSEFAAGRARPHEDRAAAEGRAHRARPRAAVAEEPLASEGIHRSEVTDERAALH